MTTPGYPLIAWGTPEDLTAWNIGATTPEVTGGQADPFGGTDAYLLTDNVAGDEYVYHDYTAPATHGSFAVFAKQGTAAQFAASIYDVTAATERAKMTVTWAGTPSAAITFGSGTAFTPIAVGGGFYLCRFMTDTVVAGNTYRIYITGAGVSPATGTTTVYLRNAVTLNPLDEMLGWQDPREGRRKVRAPSGEYDVWDTGTDYYLDAVARFIPAYDTADRAVSGWYGISPLAGVNVGVAAMLTAGRQGHDLIYAPDRATASSYIASELVEPETEGAELAPNGQRHVRVRFRNTTTEYPSYET